MRRWLRTARPNPAAKFTLETNSGIHVNADEFRPAVSRQLSAGPGLTVLADS
jgi:hypothetical protein